MFNKISIAASVLLASSMVGSIPASAVDGKSNVTVILVHGAWADGSSWGRVIPLLQAKGLKVAGVQNPLTSLEDDVAATKRVIADAEGKVVLVGHSWAGTIITEAGNDPKVAALVYVAAFAPDTDETAESLIKGYPQPPALSTFTVDQAGYAIQTEEGFLKNIAPDIPAEDAKVLAAIQGPLATKSFGEKVTQAAWKRKPSWYIVSKDDRAISPELETAAAKRMNAKTTVLESSHVSLLSHPKEVAAVIEEAATSLTSN
ncbi:alpha/beta hydrolase [Mesorhizobium sp. B2-3-3]|nr:alpha/beta hydrolase [Mesorhizobium sp. B2-3-3]